ncbi:MAG: AarF/ABC1/UbiB kinase family protein [Chloroflexi bacterium]|nr:AarF/ABC1/UbiB kinase family protein [Chloroflexota bacterium]
MNALQRIGRTRRVARTAARIFVSYRWRGWRNRRLPPEEAAERQSRTHRRNAERIYDTATSLKGLLIKVGQLIGTRADVFPDEYVEVLSQLQDAVPPHSFDVIRRVIEEDLGAPLDEIFAKFDRTPIASASLAQVHRAVLHDGRQAAVKVQYPEIAEIVRVDLQNIRMLARVAGKFLRDFDFTTLVDELSANTPLELDFVHEGHNAEASARNFADNEAIIVPDIYWEHTSKRVLCMELVDGIKISDVAALEAAGIDRKAVARLLTECYIQQIFVDGYFHADPHPGNLFVRPGPQLVIVDFGLAKRLTVEFRRGFIRLTRALVLADSAELAQAFRELGFRTRHEDDSVFDDLGKAMIDRLSRDAAFSRDRELVMELNHRMARVFRENPVVRVPGEFLLIGRTLGLLGGLGTQLGSQVNVLDLIGAHFPPAAEPAP